MAKFNELWAGVEKLLSGHDSSGSRLAVIEAHKILEAVLDNKGFIGKTIEEKLFWAGYSGKDKEGITEALERHKDIIEKIEYQFSDFEAQEAVRMYKKVAQSIVSKPDLKFSDKLKSYYEIYFSPKSIKLWVNLGIIFGFFITVRILSETEIGKNITEYIINTSNFIISWIFVAIILILSAIIIGLNVYFENKSKIKIKE